MITDDDVMRLFERADPAGGDDRAPAVDVADYVTTLRTRSRPLTLVDTEPRLSGPKNGHRWPMIAAAVVVAILVSVLWLVARDDDPSNQLPAATTIAPDPINLPLAEGVYRTPELTREQLIASGVAAGFNRADVEAHLYDGGEFATIRWDLKLADGSWRLLDLIDGWKGSQAWRGTYEVVDDDTVIATDSCGAVTYQYAFDGAQLALDMVDDRCEGGLDELIAQTNVFETAPFTLIESGQPGSATTTDPPG